MSLAVIIPVYEQPDHLGTLLSRMKNSGWPVLMINDGSGPDCSERMRTLADQNEFVTLIEREANGGKGAAVKTGLRTALKMGHSHALQIDADGQHDDGDASQFVALSNTNPDAVICGTPQFENAPR